MAYINVKVPPKIVFWAVCNTLFMIILAAFVTAAGSTKFETLVLCLAVICINMLRATSIASNLRFFTLRVQLAEPAQRDPLIKENANSACQSMFTMIGTTFVYLIAMIHIILVLFWG